MDIRQLFEDKTLEFVGGLLTLIFLAATRFFKKLPNVVSQRMRREKQLDGLKKGSEINNVIRELALNSGAIYVHIIKYHNGGPYKMSVEWESIGRSCASCITQCRNSKEIKPLQDDWVSVKISNIWLEIIEKTIQLDGHINEVDGESFDERHKDIWKSAYIDSYKEMLITHKSNKSTLVLGLSFCTRFTDSHGANYMMELACRKLSKLL